MNVRWLLLITVCGSSLVLGPMRGLGRGADDRVDYQTRIKPILSERCYACHGSLKQEAELRLDTVALMLTGGDSGAVIERGSASKSILLQRISSTDTDERMPPADNGKPLTAEQIELLQKWITQGASAPAGEQPQADPKDHWAFRPVVRPKVPAVENTTWVKNPIDAFIAQQHKKQNLSPQTEASRIILLRRLYLDLIGLPPTIEEITACENDPSPQWYEQTAERLLDDPRHGERWARHWMDIWRYSDWWGLGESLRNSQKHIWHWRDWIVESLNEDTPYDEMVRLMLAADESHPNDLDKLRATGYLARNFFLFNRTQWMEETVEHVSKGFLGLTINCTKCHDHKYDPIEQVDFYRMRAFFEPYYVRLDVVPGEPDLRRDGIPRVFDGLPNTPTYRYVRGDEKNPDKSAVITPGVPRLLAFGDLKIEPVTLPLEAWQPGLREWVIENILAASQEKFQTATADLQKSEVHLKTAQEAKDGPAISSAEAKRNVAAAAVAAARAEQDSIARRVGALRVSRNKSGGPLQQEKRIAAIHAERNSAVAKAKHAVTIAMQAHLVAAKDKKAPAEEGLKAARESLKKAIAAFGSEVKPADRVTPFTGAKWTPTRFLESRTDDTAIEFLPQSTGRRTALANWITDRRNPLTARVAANHIWTRHMGRPLVSTVFDFGQKGARPTHPELLDWLAAELIESGWSMKHLHRLIVTSATYRLRSSAAGGGANSVNDPENRSWWRREPIRLESQVVRDSILALAGALDSVMGGPPVLSAGQAKSTRRSLYFFHSNNQRNLFLTTFDEALVKDCYRREQSIVPQQALALTNSGLVLDASDQIAKRLSKLSPDDATFIRKAFLLVLAMKPNAAEITASNNALEAWKKLPDGSAEKSRAHFVWALINHNDFVTMR